ncbi:MAG: pilus assembly protein PilP [Pseudomonadota bacterium]
MSDRTSKKAFRLDLLLIVTLCLSLTAGGGCDSVNKLFGGLFGKEETPPAAGTVKGAVTKPAAEKKAKPKKEAAPKEEKQPLTLEVLRQMQEAKAREFIFRPEGMNDPFKPIAAVTIERPEPKPGETKNPLQSMELSQIKLVAVILAGDDTKALVEDSTGLGYIIQVGTLIGNRNGRVATIKAGEVVVEERYRVYGQPKVVESTLRLKPIEGEKK